MIDKEIIRPVQAISEPSYYSSSFPAYSSRARARCGLRLVPSPCGRTHHPRCLPRRCRNPPRLCRRLPGVRVLSPSSEWYLWSARSLRYARSRRSTVHSYDRGSLWCCSLLAVRSWTRDQVVASVDLDSRAWEVAGASSLPIFPRPFPLQWARVLALACRRQISRPVISRYRTGRWQFPCPLRCWGGDSWL